MFDYIVTGRLDVYWARDHTQDGIPLWTRNGTTGHAWQRAQIPIYHPRLQNGVTVTFFQYNTL